MQLTRFTDFGLRVLMYLTQCRHRSAAVTIPEIADRFSVSRNHLVKVVHFMAQQGWVSTSRGKGGGLRLAAAAHEINIGAVVRHMEPMQMVECMGPGNSCLITPSCQLAGMLAGATRAFLQHLDGFSLADLLNNATIAILYRSAPATKPPDGAI